MTQQVFLSIGKSCIKCGEEMSLHTLHNALSCKACELVKIYPIDVCRCCGSNLIRFYSRNGRILKCMTCHDSWTEVPVNSAPPMQKCKVSCAKCQAINYQDNSSNCAIEEIKCTTCLEEFELHWVIPAPIMNSKTYAIDKKKYDKFKKFEAEYDGFIKFKNNKDQIENLIETSQNIIAQIKYANKDGLEIQSQIRELSSVLDDVCYFYDQQASMVDQQESRVILTEDDDVELHNLDDLHDQEELEEYDDQDEVGLQYREGIGQRDYERWWHNLHRDPVYSEVKLFDVVDSDSDVLDDVLDEVLT